MCPTTFFQILRSSFDGLDELEKNIFLDIATFFKGELREEVEEILRCCYKGAECVISNLLDKSLLEIIDFDKISMHDMLEEMGKDIVRQESKRPEKQSRLWSPEDADRVLIHNKGTDLTKGIKDIVNLREINVSRCNKLRKIPNLLGAINLKRVICLWCVSLVELPCLNHLASLEELEFRGCHNLKKFPKVPNMFMDFDLSNTGIEEVPDSIGYLDMLEQLDLAGSRVKNVSSNILKLEKLHGLDLSYSMITEFPEIPNNLMQLNLSGTQIKEVSFCSNHLSNLHCLDMSFSSIQKLQCNIALFGSREIRLDAPIPILRFKNLRVLLMTYCDSLKLLSELPPYLQYFDANNCTSLEKVSFSDQNQDLYELHSCFAEELDCSMLFCNCFRLNQDSIDNIEANAMLKIRLLAKKWASKYDVCPPNFFSCFPGSKISASKFEYQSENSSLTLKIAPNGCNRSRFLAFSICLVADLIGCVSFSGFDFICEYQLTAASGGGHEKFRSEWHCRQQNWASMECMGDHVLILLSGDMVKNDKGYEQASFEFYIKYYGEEDIKVKKCGVHVSYVDEEPKSQPTA
ncbi:disease resistance-like protein DSC1 isoform X2 [Gossypium hirsutum]|uniref:Disease resistance-like protein DSC1 isoform X2 n=1 Tax=Gossypium hirsutum TaxID=3635 RepID=A0ABM2YWQ7_GOSHI|nr:disease resistance-like protein DSC1 isoform X2 [Gossypium hirsutum]